MSMYNYRPFDPEQFYIAEVERTAGTENAQQVRETTEARIVEEMANGGMDDVTIDSARRLKAKKIVDGFNDHARESAKKLLIDWRKGQMEFRWEAVSRVVIVINKTRRTTIGLMQPRDLDLWMENLRKSLQEHQDKQEEMERLYLFLMDKFRKYQSLERAWLMEDRGEDAA